MLSIIGSPSGRIKAERLLLDTIIIIIIIIYLFFFSF